MHGYLKYVVENCKTAFDELCKINKELAAGMSPESNADVNHLGALKRMIQDYLVIRVAGLFDKDSRTISFNNAFSQNQEVKNIEQEEIIKKIIENRNRFVGHSDHDYISEGNFAIPTNEICNSNLRSLLERLEKLL
ncbi:MAG TPA: hypothetical protein VGA53_00610 [Candidatus Paceibacterota bacterium]